MDIAVVCSRKIVNQTWIETQLIDCLYEIHSPKKILVPKGENGGGNLIVKNLLGAKYEIQEFASCWEEFGVGAVSKRNLEMLGKTHFLLALHDGKSRTVNNCIQVALRKKLPLNVRYYN